MRHTRGWTSPPPNVPLAALSFLAELVLWFGLGFATFDVVLSGGGEVLWAVLAGAGAMIAIVALWGTFVAPRALRPLRFSFRIAIIVLLYLTVGAVFLAAGWLIAGIALAVVGPAIQIAAQVVMRDWADQGRRDLLARRAAEYTDDDVT